MGATAEDTTETGGDTMSDEDKQNLHATAKQQFVRIQSVMKDERKQSLEDRRFYSIAGAQWEGPLSQQFENKPRYEVNKVHLSVIRIINEYRNNRITVNFIPKDGSKGGILTDTCNGLYRADEEKSVAEEAYDNAFEEAVGGGIGAFRYRNDFVDPEDEENEEQAIFIEPIYDADSSVYFDPDAKRQDKSDARYCFVISSITRDAFVEEYPGREAPTPSSMPVNNKDTEFDWATPDVVYLADYYKVEKVTEINYEYKGLDGTIRKLTEDDLEDDKTLAKTLTDTGFKRTKTRTIKRKRVHKFIMSGIEILEDLGLIAGQNIPIVLVYGKRWFVGNVERSMGHVRLAKDVQRLKNMQISKIAYIAAISPIAKPILTPEQIKGHQLHWAEDNLRDYPYMLVNPITDANGQKISTGPIGYTKAPDLPPASVALLQMTDKDMSDLLGNQEAGEEIQPNQSGFAMELVQAKLDMQTFIYISNMAKAIRRGGAIWLDMAKEVYIENSRKRKVINSAGEASSVTLNAPGKDEVTGVAITQNDLTEADFDVTAIPGPTSASKKAATVRALISLLQVTQDPETIQVLTAMIMMNMEGEGIEEIRDYFRNKLLTMGVVKPTTEEAAQLQKVQEEAANKPPTPQELLAKAALDEANTKSAKNQAETGKAIAETDKTRAQTTAISEETVQDGHDRVIDRLDKIQDIAIKPHEAGLAPVIQPPVKSPPVHGGTSPIVQIPEGPSQ